MEEAVRDKSGKQHAPVCVVAPHATRSPRDMGRAANDNHRSLGPARLAVILLVAIAAPLIAWLATR
jgi:hypothetical protein